VEERFDRAGDDAGPGGERLLGVGDRHRTQAGVDAQPAQRLRLPVVGAVAGPRQVHQVGVVAQDQVAQRPGGNAQRTPQE
jgi:hypothetical protein